MLTRFVSCLARNQQAVTAASSLRLFSGSALRLGDGDHTRSKAKDKASDDLKSGREKRWLDTVASDSGKTIASAVDVPSLLRSSVQKQR